MVFFSPGNANGGHSYPEKQGLCSCSYSCHEWPRQLSGGSVTWLFHVRVLCSVTRLLLAMRGQTSGAPRALNWVDSQGRCMRESERRACPKLSNPSPHYCLQADDIFHLANPSHASIIRDFFSISTNLFEIILEPPCYDSQKIPLISIRSQFPFIYSCIIKSNNSHFLPMNL